MRLLSDLHVVSRTIHVTNTNMAVTLAQFLWFLQNEGKWIKRGKKYYKQNKDKHIQKIQGRCWTK